MRRRFFRLALLASVVLGLGSAAGCYVDVDDEYDAVSYLADLEVTWRIAGSQSAGYCDSYGIDHWIVEVRGPESRDVVVDCRANYWSSENDLIALVEGYYEITVVAADALGHALAIQSTHIDLFAEPFLQNVGFQFYAYDFGY